ARLPDGVALRRAAEGRRRAGQAVECAVCRADRLAGCAVRFAETDRRRCPRAAAHGLAPGRFPAGPELPRSASDRDRSGAAQGLARGTVTVRSPCWSDDETALSSHGARDR